MSNQRGRKRIRRDIQGGQDGWVFDPIEAHRKFREYAGNLHPHMQPRLSWIHLCPSDLLLEDGIDSLPENAFRALVELLSPFHEYVDNHVPEGLNELDTVGYPDRFIRGHRRTLSVDPDRWVWNWTTWFRTLVFICQYLIPTSGKNNLDCWLSSLSPTSKRPNVTVRHGLVLERPPDPDEEEYLVEPEIVFVDYCLTHPLPAVFLLLGGLLYLI